MDQHLVRVPKVHLIDSQRPETATPPPSTATNLENGSPTGFSRSRKTICRERKAEIALGTSLTEATIERLFDRLEARMDAMMGLITAEIAVPPPVVYYPPPRVELHYPTEDFNSAGLAVPTVPYNKRPHSRLNYVDVDSAIPTSSSTMDPINRVSTISNPSHFQASVFAQPRPETPIQSSDEEEAPMPLKKRPKIVEEPTTREMPDQERRAAAPRAGLSAKQKK